MCELIGSVVPINQLDLQDINQMFSLMDLFYTNMNKDIFLNDLGRKDYCVLLRDAQGKIQGFSTQQLIQLKVGETLVHGVFSGDTIIHKQYWGSMEIFSVFASFFFPYGASYEHFYWFLTSKGYKTYKILPTFFRQFYPNCHEETPSKLKEIMDAFGRSMYPLEYKPQTGVVAYCGIKDALKAGVADVTERQLRDPHIAFFTARNPSYQHGDDLVCLVELAEHNLKPAIRKMFFSGREEA